VVSRLEGEFKSVESRFDEEHNLWEVRFVNSQGAEHVINWELASTPECRQLISKFKLIEQYLEPPLRGGGAKAAGQRKGRGRGGGTDVEDEA
jgi:hypothetical protein